MSYSFSFLIIEWYSVHKRDLPWRNTRNPYKIWISEIILQQTRVAQGMGYYHRFIAAFPTIQALATASLDEVLKLWQGLGYYSRARNLHETAKHIVTQLDGKFPESYKELIKLKGIGDYTASAIVSFAFKVPVAAVDGNVYRVLSRYYGIFTPIDSTKGKKELNTLAQAMVDKLQPDTFNQAMMDFGALMCTPQKPVCNECPLHESCYAFRYDCISQLPVKSKKTAQSTRYFSYILIKQGKYTYIHKRQAKDIWHSLYEFPLIETMEEVKPEDLPQTKQWQELFGNEKITITHISPLNKHVLSHQLIMNRFYVVELDNKQYKPQVDFIKIKMADFNKYSTPKMIENFITDNQA